MTARFTDKWIRGLKAGPDRRTFTEAGGLSIRVAPGGTKTFSALVRMGPEVRRVSLGIYRDSDTAQLGQHSDRNPRGLPYLTLADARVKLAEAMRLRDGGIDPTTKAKAEHRRVQKGLTVGALIDRYLIWAKKNKKASSASEDERQLEKDVRPPWGDRKAATVTRDDVIALLAGVVDRGSPVAANRLFAVVRKMFRFAVRSAILDHSPAVEIDKPGGKEKPRERALSDAELLEVWQATHQLNGVYGPIYRLLMATGQRRSEVAGIRGSELTLGTKIWIMPGRRTKNGLEHLVPLSTLALESLKPRLAKVPADYDCVFATGKKGDAPPVEFKAAKRRLDAIILNNRRAAAEASGLDPEEVEPMTKWTLRDLRRTVRTGLAKIGVPDEHAERVVNHVPASMVKTYNVYQYRKEKREALASWAAHLRIVTGTKPKRASNVIR